MQRFSVLSLFILNLFLAGDLSWAGTTLENKVAALEARVEDLENHVKEITPHINSVSKNIMNHVESQIKDIKNTVIVLNPVSNKFVKIETNVGTFLISVNKMEQTEKGYLLYIYIGNPYGITYSGATIRLRWGKKWDRSFAKLSFQGWRQSLTGAQYTFPGAMEPGKWTDVVVDVSPADQLEYVECELDIGTAVLTR